ncbi:hypothetical protein LSUE1_G008978, partial [Lachnellula suecica]
MIDITYSSATTKHNFSFCDSHHAYPPILLLLLSSITSTSASNLIPRAASWPYQSFKTVNFTPPELSISKSGAPLASGLLFFTPESLVELAALITTDNGTLIWSSPSGLYYNFKVQELDTRPVLTYWLGEGSANTALVGHGYGSVRILDTSYTQIYKICPNISIVAPTGTDASCYLDLHESYVTPRGSLLATAYNITTADLSAIGGSIDGWIYDCLFYEIDIKTQDILFQWSAYKAGIPITATRQPLSDQANVTVGNVTALPGTRGNPFDWFHINAVQSVGEGYLLNSRNTWTTFRLNSTGGILWEFEGDTGGDFSLPEAGHFAWQHDARILLETPNSVILTYFNNANSQPPFNGTNASTGLIFYLDLTAKTATLLQSLSDPDEPLFVDTQGSLSLLENGNRFMDYGQLPIMKEYGPAGDVRLTIQFGPQAAAESYRGYRLNWHASPAAKPDVVVENGTVYFSWNGATDVQSWDVYAGSKNVSLARVGTVEKKGFESSF